MNVLKGYKTYIAGGLLIASTLLSFAGIDIPEEQLTQVQTGLLALVAIFLRMGVADSNKNGG